MSKKNEICHSGIIKSISEDKIEISILAQSACSSCHSKGMCGMSETEEKIIEIFKFTKNKYKKGDNVNIGMNKNIAGKAVFFGYLLPFIIMMIAMLTVNHYSSNDAITGITTLLSIGIYYLTLSLFRKKLNKSFTFYIK